MRRFLSSPIPLCLLCIAIITTVLYWRRPDAFYNPQLWAEDGSVFFSDALKWGSGSIFLPMAGYFHIIARFVAWMGRWLPYRYAPLWYVFISWGILSSIVVYIFSTRFPFSLGIKFLLGLTLVITTVDNEVFLNLANLAFLSAFFWLLLAISNEPRSGLEVLFDILLLVLTGLNTPFAVCLWLLFLVRWRIRLTRHSLILFLLSLAVAGIQFLNMPQRMQSVGVPPNLMLIYADLLVYRFGFMFLGEQFFRLTLSDSLRIYGLVLMGIFYGSLFWLAIKGRSWESLALLIGGILTWALSLYVIRRDPASWIHAGGRHVFVPTITLAWALLLLDFKAKYLKWGILCAMFIAFLFFTPYDKKELRPDLKWTDHVEWCVKKKKPNCKIPINPIWDPPIWFAVIPSPHRQ